MHTFKPKKCLKHLLDTIANNIYTYIHNVYLIHHYLDLPSYMSRIRAENNHCDLIHLLIHCVDSYMLLKQNKFYGIKLERKNSQEATQDNEDE